MKQTQFVDDILNFLKPYHILFMSPALEKTIVRAAGVTAQLIEGQIVLNADKMLIEIKEIDILDALRINLYLKAICNAQLEKQPKEGFQFEISTSRATNDLLPFFKKHFLKQIKKSAGFLKYLQQESNEEKKRRQIQAIVTACMHYSNELKKESTTMQRQIFSLIEDLLDCIQKIEANRTKDFSKYVATFRTLAQQCANIIAERSMSKTENGLRLIKALEDYDESLPAASSTQKLLSLGIFPKPLAPFTPVKQSTHMRPHRR